MKFVKQTLSFAAIAALFVGCSAPQDTDPVVATVGDEKIYASDVEFLRKSSPAYAKPGQEKAALENILESRIINQEAKKLVGENFKIADRLNAIEDRMLSQVYDDYFIGENLGYDVEKLRSYFASNRAAFAADSCKSFEACRERVARSLYLSDHADSLAHYKARKIRDMERVRYNFLYAELGKDSAEIERVEKALRDEKENSDEFKDIIKSGFVRSDTVPEGTFGNAAFRESLFGKNPLSAGDIRKIDLGEKTLVFKVVLRREGDKVPEADRDSVLEDRFIFDLRDYMANNADSILQAKYGFRVESAVYPDARAYYEAHPEEFNGTPFDSVSASIKKKLSTTDMPLDSGAVLATIGGKPFILESDAARFLAEISPSSRMRYPRARRVFMLASWKLKALAAREANLDKSSRFEKIRNNIETSFYRKFFSDSLAARGFLAPEDSLRAAFEKFGTRLFPNRPFEQIRGELGVLVQTPLREYLFEYYRNPSLPQTSDVDSIRVLVFEGSMMRFAGDWFERYRRDLYKKYPVTVYDSVYLPRTDLFSVTALEAVADSFYNARELSGARVTWERIRALSAEDDTLFRRAILELAQIDSEREKYESADGEFAAYYAIWPDSPEAEKALFNRAFLLHENLKRDSVALPLFEEFQKKFPKSDLAESVDWLVRDIRSGGKLAAELLEKISKQEESSN